MTTYSIFRFHRDRPLLDRVIRKGLTLEEAREWCRDPETSSSTATKADNVAYGDQFGPWFDGYTEDAA